MLIKKLAYWGAGLACSGVIFLVGVIVADSLYVSPHYTAQMHSQVKSDLNNLYFACLAYWEDTNPGNACTENIYSLTTYGYIQSSHVVIWGRGGNQFDFNLKAKSLHADGVYSLTIKTIKAETKDDQVNMDIKRLINEELESALAEMNKLKD